MRNATRLKRNPDASRRFQAAFSHKGARAQKRPVRGESVALLEIPGRRDEATAHIEAVLRLQPGNEPAQKVLARIRASRP
jgi:hypothetical protein